MTADLDSLLSLAHQIVDQALEAGAGVAEAVVAESSELSARVRLGQVEVLEEASQRSAGLRVIKSQRVALTSTSDLTEAGLKRFVHDAVELADLSEPDPYAGPAAPDLIDSAPGPDLELFDPQVGTIDARQATDMALAAEQAARDFDKRITNMQSSTCARVTGASAMVLSGGFQSARHSSVVSLGVVPVADDTDGKKRRGSWFEARRFTSDLPTAEWIGTEAARRTVRMLGARKVPSCTAPVIFPQETASSILGLFASCVVGSAIWRHSSYLLGKQGSRVASDLVNIVDDPLRPRGFGSRAHDGEGLASRVNSLVVNGMLQDYLCDSYAGRKLARASTASAARGGNGAVGPSCSNLLLKPVAGHSEEQIIASTQRGLYVTEMMGFGFNPTTGDFSRGASGMWIEDGHLAFPVSEVTISLNLHELLQRIDAVADSVVLRGAVLSPMLRVSEMTLSGS